MEPKYEFLEHVSDAYIATYGRSLEEAFQNAALAMFEVMTDTHKIEAGKAADTWTVPTGKGAKTKWVRFEAK
jgi:SHS2 domain-containing protein